MHETHTHIYQIFIQTTPEKLWQALTDVDLSRQYYFNTRVESNWQVGSSYTYKYDTGEIMIQGEVLEADPFNRLVTTFQPFFAGDEASQHISKVTFEIEEMGDTCKLKLTHDDLDPTHPLTQGLMEGWAKICSSLKTLLETEEPM